MKVAIGAGENKKGLVRALLEMVFVFCFLCAEVGVGAGFLVFLSLGLADVVDDYD